MDKRPVGVTILAGLYFLVGIVILAAAVLGLFAPQKKSMARVGGGIVLAIFAFGLSWGLGGRHKWGFRLTLLTNALALLVQIGLGILLLVDARSDLTQTFNELTGVSPSSEPTPIIGLTLLFGAAASSLTVWYLGHSPVRNAFEAANPQVDDVPTEPQGPLTARQFAPPKLNYQETPAIASLSKETASSAPAWLIARSGPLNGQQFPLNRERNTIGRDAVRASIKVDDPQVSRQHAQFNFEQGQVFLYDLASTNGTYVNNKRVRKQKLTDGDTVRVGQTVFVFKQKD